MLFTSLAVATLSAVASAKTIRIDVGENGALNFTPDNLQASTGDILEFHYHSINHSVVAADFAKPCQPKAEGGFYSGFFPTSSGENDNVFQVAVNNTSPIWFYCSQPVGNHCGSGMVGAVNANSSNTLAQFKAAAEMVSNDQSPSSGPFGGKIVSAASASKTTGGSSTTSTSGSSSGTSTSTAPAATTTNAAATLGSVSGMALAVVGAAVAFAI
ncbi:Cupredoxin [Trichoderma ceciliae]